MAKTKKNSKLRKTKNYIIQAQEAAKYNLLQTQSRAQEFDKGYSLGYKEGVQDALKTLPEPKIEYKIPEGCRFMCHICQPPVALASIDDRPQHMREVHNALKW